MTRPGARGNGAILAAAAAAAVKVLDGAHRTAVLDWLAADDPAVIARALVGLAADRAAGAERVVEAERERRKRQRRPPPDRPRQGW